MLLTIRYTTMKTPKDNNPTKNIGNLLEKLLTFKHSHRLRLLRRVSSEVEKSCQNLKKLDPNSSILNEEKILFTNLLQYRNSVALITATLSPAKATNNGCHHSMKYFNKNDKHSIPNGITFSEWFYKNGKLDKRTLYETSLNNF